MDGDKNWIWKTILVIFLSGLVTYMVISQDISFSQFIKGGSDILKSGGKAVREVF